MLQQHLFKGESVGEKVAVEVECKPIGTLARHDQDHLLPGDSAQFAKGPMQVQHVFKHMGANHGIEAGVWKRQVFDIALHEGNAMSSQFGTWYHIQGGDQAGFRHLHSQDAPAVASFQNG